MEGGCPTELGSALGVTGAGEGYAVGMGIHLPTGLPAGSRQKAE